MVLTLSDHSGVTQAKQMIYTKINYNFTDNTSMYTVFGFIDFFITIRTYFNTPNSWKKKYY